MADVAKFAISLEDLVSPGANKAQTSVDSLSSTLRKAKGDLAGYKSQLSLSKDLGDVEGFRKYSALVDGSKSKILGLTQQLEGAKSELSAGAAEGFASALGLIGIASGVAVAGLAGLASVIKFGVVTALEEANEKARYLAGFEALGGKGAGQQTMAMLDELGAKLPQSEAQLVQWTKHLQAMGITDTSKIRSELIATASAQAVMGDEGAAAYQKIQERVRLAVEAHHGLKMAEKSLKALYSAGVNQADVAQRMGMTTQELSAKLKAGTIDAAKFGNALSASVTEKGKGPLDVMMNSLDAMGKRFHKLLGDLFEDVDTKPLTDALRIVISLFDKAEPSGEAMGKGITGGLNAVIRVLASGIESAEYFFLSLEAGALKAYIAVKPLIAAYDKISGGMDSVGTFLRLGNEKPVEGQMTAIPGALQTNMGVGDMLMNSLSSALLGVPSLLSSIGDAKAQEIARQGGIAIGQATMDGVREGVDAHSPSRAAALIGLDIGAGLGAGMEQSSMPDRAARTISANALGGLAGGAGALGGANDNASAGPTSIGPIEVNIMAPSGVTDAHAISVAGLSAALERFQLGSGR